MARGRSIFEPVPCGLAAIGLAACAIGFRGQASFTAEHDITGIEELRIELPDTPIEITGCPPAPAAAGDDDDDDDGPPAGTCPAVLSYRGLWASTGGTAKVAEDNALTPALIFAREGAFASLTADIPLSVVGLVDLEMREITVPDDRDLDVRTGLGDVTITGMEATVAVQVDIGDVDIVGGAQGVAVDTGRGTIDVITSGHADLRSDRGSVTVEQTGDARDLLVTAQRGDIEVVLASDADIDLVVESRGDIRVDTERITTITAGAFERRLGTGAIQVVLRAPTGSVTVTAAD